MMKRLIVSLFMVCALLTASMGAGALTADAIISKSVAAQGGAKALLGMSDSTIRGVIKSGGVVGKFIAYSKIPDKIRVDIDFGMVKHTEGFDGRVAWQTIGSKVKVLSGAEAAFVRKEANDTNDMLVRYKQRGIKTQLLGTGKVDGKSAHVVKWIYKDGTFKKIYFDPANFLMIAEERFRPAASGKPTYELTKYSDFRRINGVLTPFKISVINKFGKSEVQIQQIQTNTQLGVSLFQKPAS